MVSTFSALFTMSSLYGLVSPFMSSILSNCLSCSSSCCTVSVLIILPDSVFLYMYLICSLVKNFPLLGLLLFTCPHILVLRGKNAIVPSLLFISLKDSPLDFLLNYFVDMLIKRFAFLPDWASVEVVLFLLVP